MCRPTIYVYIHNFLSTMYIMSSYINNFKATDFIKRLNESNRVSEKHPNRCSVIVGRMDGTDIPELDKHKFLVPRELSVGQFSHVLRKRIKLTPEKAMFIFANKTLPAASQSMGSLYDKCKHQDNFLYISYASENTFG